MLEKSANQTVGNLAGERCRQFGQRDKTHFSLKGEAVKLRI